jgi:hypothetical protein
MTIISVAVLEGTFSLMYFLTLSTAQVPPLEYKMRCDFEKGAACVPHNEPETPLDRPL